MNGSTFWMIKYMNGSVFSKARYMNGVGFEILARTPVPKLPLSYPLTYLMTNSADPDQLASWLLQKPTVLDLHCLQRQGISRFSRTRVNCGIENGFVSDFIVLMLNLYWLKYNA